MGWSMQVTKSTCSVFYTGLETGQLRLIDPLAPAGHVSAESCHNTVTKKRVDPDTYLVEYYNTTYTVLLRYNKYVGFRFNSVVFAQPRTGTVHITFFGTGVCTYIPQQQDLNARQNCFIIMSSVYIPKIKVHLPS